MKESTTTSSSSSSSSSSTSASSSSSSFDIETYISRYQSTSNITLQRLLFVSRNHDNNNDKEATNRGFQLLEQRLKQKGNAKMYRQVFCFGKGERKEDMNMEGATAADACADADTMDIDLNFDHPDMMDGGVVAPEDRTDSGYDDDDDDDHVAASMMKRSDNPMEPAFKNIPFDPQYLQSIEAKSSHQLQILEANLSQSQDHLNKDSIRNSLLALAKFYQNRGECEQAIRYYQKAKQYCFTTNTSAGSASGSAFGPNATNACSGSAICNSQTNDIILSLAECGLEARKTHYDDMILNITTTDTTNNTSDNYYNSKLKCLRGLAYLNKKEYYNAATTFLSINQVDFTNQYNTILSNEDIALYGGVLGLIAFNRSQIESFMEGVEAWRERLGSIPHLQDAIKFYMKADYGGSLTLLNSISRGHMMRDLFLSNHVDTLLTIMREKCILQYLQPYSSVSLINMTNTFGFDNVDQVEDMVSSLIESKQLIGAKIDGVNNVLTKITKKGYEQKKRHMMMTKIGMMGDRLIHEVEDYVLRMSCLENNVVVTGGFGRRRGGDEGDGGRLMSSAGGGILDMIGDGDGGGGGMMPYECIDSSSDDEGNFDYSI